MDVWWIEFGFLPTFLEHLVFFDVCVHWGYFPIFLFLPHLWKCKYLVYFWYIGRGCELYISFCQNFDLFYFNNSNRTNKYCRKLKQFKVMKRDPLCSVGLTLLGLTVLIIDLVYLRIVCTFLNINIIHKMSFYYEVLWDSTDYQTTSLLVLSWDFQWDWIIGNNTFEIKNA